MRITCRKALASGMKAGLIVIPEPLNPIIAMTKQSVMPMVKIKTITSIALAVAFLLFMYSKPTSQIAASVTSASPK